LFFLPLSPVFLCILSLSLGVFLVTIDGHVSHVFFCSFFFFTLE
jgi:hypothetical protein